MQNKSWFLVRQFGAFIIDCALWGLLLVILSHLLPSHYSQWGENVGIATLLGAFVVLDSVSLAWRGTSLGRWLFGMSLKRSDGSKPNIVEAVESNLIFWFMTGVITQIWWVMMIGLAFLIYDYIQHHSWLWERAVNLVPEYKAISKVKILVGLSLLAVIIVIIVMGWNYSGLSTPTAVSPSYVSSSRPYYNNACLIMPVNNRNGCPKTQTKLSNWWW